MSYSLNVDYRQTELVEDEAGAAYAALRSVLRSWLSHTRGKVLQAFGLTTDTVTLRQLAAVFLQHNGSTGQAFEWAVHEALNDPRRHEIRDLVSAAMDLCGYKGSSLRSVMFANEAFKKQDFMSVLLNEIGNESRVRLYRRSGRPYNLQPVVRQIEVGGIAALSGSLQDFGRADLLLAREDDSGFIAASCKLNAGDAQIWPGVPLWIVAEPIIGRRREPLLNDPANGRVIVTIPMDSQFLRAFMRAEHALDVTCRAICDRSTRGHMSGDLLETRMVKLLGTLAEDRVLDVADQCDALAQPGLIRMGIDDHVRIPAPSWLSQVLNVLFQRSNFAQPEQAIDVARPMLVTT